MTWQSGGGGGIPGVTSDGQTPGGEIIAGALIAGNTNKDGASNFHYFYGQTVCQDTPGGSIDGDDVFDVSQSIANTAPGAYYALNVSRSGDISAHDYNAPAAQILDSTLSAQPALRVIKGGGTQLQVDGDGVRIHSKLKTGASVTHTLGAYSGKSVPIYDESGTLLGYMPLYA